MRHKWRQFNDLAIKTVAADSPVATLSPNNSNTVSLFAISFSKNRPFSPDFGGSVAFWRLFAKNKSLATTFHSCNHTLLLESYGLFYCDTAASNYGFADSIGWMCN
jgi:hypothetical protein